MPHGLLSDGLYLVKQRAQVSKSGVEHYGIMNVGNRLAQSPAHGFVRRPVVYHNTPPSLRAEWLTNTGGWAIVSRIEDERAAIARLRAAWRNPSYDMLGNNCEHFAFYVATGERKSPQVRAGVTIASIAAIVIAGLSSDKRSVGSSGRN